MGSCPDQWGRGDQREIAFLLEADSTPWSSAFNISDAEGLFTKLQQSSGSSHLAGASRKIPCGVPRQVRGQYGFDGRSPRCQFLQ
jgi:hypothetical protein